MLSLHESTGIIVSNYRVTSCGMLNDNMHVTLSHNDNDTVKLYMLGGGGAGAEDWGEVPYNYQCPYARQF